MIYQYFTYSNLFLTIPIRTMAAGCDKDKEKDLTKSPSTRMYYPPIDVKNNAQVKTMTDYNAMYKESIENPTKFWTNYSKKFYFKQKHEGFLTIILS